MQVIPVASVRRGFGQTARRDAWWTAPLVVFIGFSAFVVYATWAAFQNAHYTFGPYLSPFYSPEIFGASPHSWFGPKPDWWPGLLPFSPALIILPFPGLFPLHVLLLPRRLLQVVLGGSARLRGRRTSQAISGRAQLPADSAERPSLLHVGGGRVHRPAGLRRVGRDVVHRPGHRPGRRSASASAR